MKRFFCDLCESEMNYSTPAVVNTNDTLRTVLIRGNLEVSLRVKIEAKRIEARGDARPGWQPGRKLAPLAPIRHHADLCHACRWALLEHLRGDHSAINDTPLPPVAKELKWDAPKEAGSDDGFHAMD